MGLYRDLLGHNLEKFGAVTVFDATFYKIDSNEPLITFDTLTVSNISFSGEQKEIRGGQGAELLLTYDYGKTAEVEITDALASMFSLQYLTGGKLTGEFTAVIRRELVESETGTWTLPHPPVGGEATVHKFKDGVETIDTEITLTNDVDTVTVSDADRVIIYYEAQFDNEAETRVGKSQVGQITITANDFPPVVRLVGDTIFMDIKEGVAVEAQVEIPKFKLGTDFELSFEAEGDASVFDFSGTALAHNGELVIIRTLGKLGADEENHNQGEILTGENPE